MKRHPKTLAEAGEELGAAAGQLRDAFLKDFPLDKFVLWLDRQLVRLLKK